MNPKTGPKSELTLSARPEVGRWVARTRNAILLIVVVATLYLSGASSVDARSSAKTWQHCRQHPTQKQCVYTGPHTGGFR